MIPKHPIKQINYISYFQRVSLLPWQKYAALLLLPFIIIPFKPNIMYSVNFLKCVAWR